MALPLIFSEILAMSVTGSITAVLILALKNLFRNKFSSGWHFYIWVILLVRLVIPFNPPDSFNMLKKLNNSLGVAITQSLKPETASPDTYEPDAAVPSVKSPANHQTDQINTGINENQAGGKSVTGNKAGPNPGKDNKPVLNYNVLGVIWISGMLIILLYTIVSSTIMHLWAGSRPLCRNEEINGLFNKCREEMKVLKNIPIILDGNKRTPFLFGAFRPKLLISSKLTSELTKEEMRYIFLHELAHYKRKDIFVLWAVTIIQAIHWFNPIIWYVFYILRQDCEVACDSAVINKINHEERKNYGQTLINLVKNFTHSRPIPGATGIAAKSQIKRRIIMITTPHKKSMKWSFLSILTILIIAAFSLQVSCTVNSSRSTSENIVDQGKTPSPSNTPDDSKKSNIMDNFNALTAKEQAVTAIAGFITDNITSVSKEDASAMVIKLEELQKKYLSELTDKYFKGNDIQIKMEAVYKQGFDINKLDTIKDTDLKNLLTETRDGGYKVETAEGTYFPIINYEFYKKFSNYVTSDIKDYIEILAVESNKVPAKDAALMISFEEVVKRALSQEEYLNKYASSLKAEDMKNLYKKYITFTLYGLNNTPLFDYDNKQMKAEAKSAYTAAASGSSLGSYTRMLKEYIEVLIKNNFKLTDEVEKFRKSYSQQ